MKKTTKRTILNLGLVVVASLLVAYLLLGRGAALPEGLIQANGRLEGDQVTAASKFAGRVEEVFVEEGDVVRVGDRLVRLDNSQVEAKVEQARHAVSALGSAVRAAEGGLDVLRQQVPLAMDSAEAGVAHAQAVVDKAEAAEVQARRDAERFRELARKGSVGAHRSEQANLAWTVADKDVASAHSAHTVALRTFSEARLGPDQIRVKETEVEGMQAQLEQARAALAEAESIESDLTIVAASDGVVTTRLVDPGETIAGGAPLVDMVDLDGLYLKVYVPEVEIGKLRRGLEAHVFVDAFPEEAYPATVRTIASRAEFTPKEVQTPDERVKLVFAVKLYLSENPGHRLTPGMPADAVIRWQKEAEWALPIW